MQEHPNIQRRRIRLLYSLKDIQLALSAADFLQDCKPDEPISKVELRRYKCYETTAIVAYARPFSDSRGGFPKLSMKVIGVKLDEEESKLHDKIMDLRNRAVAHSDAELMRMVVELHNVNLGNGESIPYIATSFDEGLDFVGYAAVSQVLNLFHRVYGGVFDTLLEDARRNPSSFHFRHDYLDPKM